MKVGHCQALYNRKGHSDRGGLFYYLQFREGDLLERSGRFFAPAKPTYDEQGCSSVALAG